MLEIIIRQVGPDSWAWYIRRNNSEHRSIASCQSYYSRPDVAWRHAMNALEETINSG